MLKQILLAVMAAAAFASVPIATSAQSRGVVITREAPPAPRAERRPGARPGWEWAPGHWTWRNGRYVWVDGRWMRGRRGWHWVPERWIDRRGRWEMIPGQWVRGPGPGPGGMGGPPSGPPNRR
jgi:hypothetical protein